MHMITINNTTCDTGHRHACSFTQSKHRHPWGYEKNHNLKSVKSIEKPLYLWWNKFQTYQHYKSLLGSITEGPSVLTVWNNKYIQGKKGICYCIQRTDVCKMHIHVPMNSMF